MNTKKIIPCLDIKDGRIVKGVNFKDLKDAGDPVETAAFYGSQGADEIALLNIDGKGKSAFLDILRRVSRKISLPLLAGGGFSNLDDIEKALSFGASKISINTAALRDPDLVKRASRAFGKERIVVAIDVKKTQDNIHRVFSRGGCFDSGKDVWEWALQVQDLGAGEILLTTIDKDGTKDGFDVDLTRKIRESLDIKVIASGGAGNIQDFLDVFKYGKADSALAASVFHYGVFTVMQVKIALAKEGVPVKL